MPLTLGMNAVVQYALAVDDLVLLRVEGGCVVLEVLDEGAGLGSFVQNLGLPLINATAAIHGAQPGLEEIHGSVGAPIVCWLRTGRSCRPECDCILAQGTRCAAGGCP